MDPRTDPPASVGRGAAARVLLADDHAMVRGGVRLMLEEAGFAVVAEVCDGVDAVGRAAAPDVDLAVLDLAMPGMSGLEAARELSRRRPDLRVVVLSMHDDEQYAVAALRAGACGYVVKPTADEDLVAACRAAMRGEPFLSPAVVARLGTDGAELARHAARRGPTAP